MATPPTIETACPECGAKFTAPIDAIGKRSKCTKCGERFEIVPRRRRKLRPLVPGVDYIGVDCLVCGTRLYGVRDEIGTPLECPDCEHFTVLRAPELGKPSHTVDAMSGPQYELWQGTEQPWGIDLVRGESPHVTFNCEYCLAVLHADPQLTGERVRCPECGKMVVIPVPVKNPARSVLSSDDIELLPPEVDSKSIPSTVIREFDRLSPEEQQQAMHRVATIRPRRKAPPGGRGPASLFRVLLVPAVASRAIALGVVVLVGVGLIHAGVAPIMSSSGGAGPGAAGPVILGFCIALLGSLALAYGLMALAADCVTVITETSEGNEHIEAWPPNSVADWIPPAFTMLVAVLIGTGPGAMAAWPLPAGSVAAIVLPVVITWLVQPLVILSQLAGDSPWSVFAPQVLGSLLRRPAATVGFYFATALLGLAIAALLWVGANRNSHVAVGAAVLIPAASLLYAHALGRLAWAVGDQNSVSG